mmetsp:Transcript_30121/g.34592  ORF Transcript_30121/g.34592 Transcript_30121/m.34592 type:complete len:231 (-) Transcript_30121:46-738(-)
MKRRKKLFNPSLLLLLLELSISPLPMLLFPSLSPPSSRRRAAKEKISSTTVIISMVISGSRTSDIVKGTVGSEGLLVMMFVGVLVGRGDGGGDGGGDGDGVFTIAISLLVGRTVGEFVLLVILFVGFCVGLRDGDCDGCILGKSLSSFLSFFLLSSSTSSSLSSLAQTNPITISPWKEEYRKKSPDISIQTICRRNIVTKKQGDSIFCTGGVFYFFFKLYIILVICFILQ